MNRDRAVSEVVGFVLVFSLITMTVGVVYVAGFEGLTGARDAERVNNAERAFDVLAHNVEDIGRDGAPGRSTEVKLADAQLSFGEETTVSWCWDEDGSGNASNDCDTANNSQTLRPIVFEADGTRIVYENGAVIRSQDGGAIVRRAPEMVFRGPDSAPGPGETVVLPTIVMNQQETSGVGGESTVLVRTQLQSGQGGRSTLEPRPTADGAIQYRINTSADRAAAWERYLDDQISWQDDACRVTDDDEGVVTCWFDADRTTFPVVRIDATFA
ncbi:DUF7289 family protein [Halomarina oriensis]|uniref:Uncharacterized protein n=1 Tax=Halomarina oriensis TaxID=671145 RepID=A0A6B0GKP3_9EURY|nr:hypothetical protein [Halomarina oriensis]MWG33363.1 hypothetical protein [Halomarina oriensis]